MYVRLCKGLYDPGKLVAEDEVWGHITNSETDWYQSIFYYDEAQYQEFQKTKTIRGVRDVETNKLVFDFDNKKDPDYARQESRTVVYRLTKLGIKQEDIQLYFSGNKGFNIVITLNRYITPDQAAAIAMELTPDLKLDLSMYDHSQLLRVAGTKHQVSGLYKIPLTANQFFNASLAEIKALASNLKNIKDDDFQWGQVALPDSYYELKFKEEKKKEPAYELDLSKKPKAWKNCKWSLLQGNFKSGDRHEALVRVAATCRGMGYDKETSYYMCKSALKKQSALTGQEEFDKSELWKNIIEDSIFSDKWEGGQYSCKSDPWLRNYCESLEDGCKDHEDDEACVDFDNMGKMFVDYATNFETNIIKTGYKELDDNVMLVASTLNGLLGQPGAGKTSASLNYLKRTSMSNIDSVFFSMDMGLPIIYAKLVQKDTGYNFKKVLNIFKTNPVERDRLISRVKEDYKNVGFNFRSGLTVPDIRNVVQERQEKNGKPVKLVVIDYLECIAGPYSDQTANTGFIANQLKDLANELNTCILLLLQTQKHSTPDISDPLLSLKGVKGSSLIEQSCSTILTLWREGYNPKHTEDDRYISFAVVKNRFGSLWYGDFHWDGVTGNIESLTEEQREELANFKRYKIEEKLKALRESADGGWDR